MPKLCSTSEESQRYFVKNVLLKALEENQNLPIQLRISRMSVYRQVGFTYGHPVQKLFRWLDKYKQYEEKQESNKEG